MNFVSTLLQIQNQIRIFHWQTEKHSEHEALGNAYKELDSLVDSFIEEFMGKYGKIRSEKGFIINIKNIENDINDTVNEFIKFTSTELSEVIKEEDTNLSNIRDEILGSLTKLKYLLTLK